MKRRASTFLVLALVLALASGCASKYGEQRTAVNYYPSCYAPIQDLRDREHDVAKTTAGGAVIGALSGALIGLLASGKAEGALAGGVAGGILGTAAGNIYANKQREADDNKRLVAYLQDMDGDISNMDIDAAAARNSFYCYERAFQSLLVAIREKRVTPEVARKRYAEIRSGEEEAAAIFGDLTVRSQDLQTQYEQAFVQEEKALTSPQRAARSNPAPKVAAFRKARTKTDSFAAKKRQFSEEKKQINAVVSKNDEDISVAMRELGDLEQNRQKIRS